MKTLSEIRRNIVSFYSAIQDRVTDFSVSSVAGSLFYSFSASLEGVYEELEDIRRQAYVSTATGSYLDRLIEGTFQLSRTPPTRAVGYVVIYANSPISSPESIELRYADYNYETGEFAGGVQNSTKFVGFNLQGEEGVVFALINPRNTEVLLPSVDPDSNERLIYLDPDRPVQFIILPVASVIRGRKANVREGGIYSFPSPPPGVAGVLNTSNPGVIFFSSKQAISGAPFYSRFTEIMGYNNATSSFSVLNAFNFSNRGFVEITGDSTRENEINATYTDGTLSRSGGLIFEYIDSSTSNITLSLPIENSLNQIPFANVVEDGEVVQLELTEFTYKGVTYPADDEVLRQFIEDNIDDGLRIAQIPDQIDNSLIFDPDNVITADYRMIDSARVGGASNVSTDAEYREALRKYLASLTRATPRSLEAGSLQISGVSFARTLPSALSPRGSATVLASDENGTLPSGLRGRIRSTLDGEWKAAGINLIIREPDLIRTNITVTARIEAGVFRNSITQQVLATSEEYFRNLRPGDSIRYSDLLEAIVNIGGVTNAFNLIVSRYLSDSTYAQYKGAYDNEVLRKVSSSGVIEVYHESHTFPEYTMGDKAILVKRDSNVYEEVAVAGTDPTPEEFDEADGILYARVDDDNYLVFEGNVESLYNLFNSLVTNSDAVTVDYFSGVLLDNIEVFGAGQNERLYFLSYILGEPLEELGPENYPLIPDRINYSVIRDYDSLPVELFRNSIVNIGTTPTLLVGIKYI